LEKVKLGIGTSGGTVGWGTVL